MGSLIILDQWAGSEVSAGTNKNWLYDGLAKYFDIKVINADQGLPLRKQRYICLLEAVISSPFQFREKYHKVMEWAAKRPSAFKTRSRRFQKAIDRLVDNYDAVLQIGCLFGPVVLPSSILASYHDQTVAMVERGWKEWLPPDFVVFRDEWMELEKKALSSRQVIFTYSERTKRSMVEDYGIEEKKVMVVPTACKIEYPREDEVLVPRKEMVLFPSTDFRRKGGELVLEAFALMRRERPWLELIVVGGPSPLKMPEGVRHLGMVTQASLRQLYLDSTLILYPALYDAFPNVLKEAQACGLPAVASGSVGIPEIVTHNRSGIILRKPDVKSLAQEVLELLDSPGRLSTMREACLVDRERFKPEKCVERIAQALLHAISKNRLMAGAAI